MRKVDAFRNERHLALLHGRAYHGKVTKVALACGFTHIGRLTQQYHRHFEETFEEVRHAADGWADENPASCEP